MWKTPSVDATILSPLLLCHLKSSPGQLTFISSAPLTRLLPTCKLFSPVSRITDILFSLFSILLPGLTIFISSAQCQPVPPTGWEDEIPWVHLCVLLQLFSACLLSACLLLNLLPGPKSKPALGSSLFLNVTVQSCHHHGLRWHTRLKRFRLREHFLVMRPIC